MLRKNLKAVLTSKTFLTSLLLLITFLTLAQPGLAESFHPKVQNAINYSTDGCTWSPPIKESSGVYYECPGGTVLGGMQHSGDENGDTKYQCCALVPQPVKKTACAWSDSIRESNSNFYCPSWQAMAGRRHSGDENGNTKYYCCNLENPVGQMWPDDVSCQWIGPQKQSKSDLQCPDGQVMRGRSHHGDENGDTEIYCCTFQGNS